MLVNLHADRAAAASAFIRVIHVHSPTVVRMDYMTQRDYVFSIAMLD